MTDRIVAPLSAEERSAGIAAVRRLAGTQFKHRGRSAAGIDCIGLCVHYLQAVGRTVSDALTYQRLPSLSDAGRLRSEMCAHFGAPVSDRQPGDWVLMQWHQHPCHVALLVDYHGGGLGVIHADALKGRVVEHSFAGPWPRRVRGVWRP